jgi:nitroreductase
MALMNEFKVKEAQMINQLISKRRSVFTDQFDSGKKVPDEIVWQMLENANQAPTHKQTEPWRFTVFTGEGLKKLAADQARIYKAFAGAKFKQNKYEKLMATPILCSHVIAIGLKRHSKEVPELEEIAAVACAVQNMYLTATAYGVGCYWSTGGITFIEEAKPLFGLESQDIFMGFLYIGQIKIPSVGSKRTSVQNKTTWISRL